MTDILIAYNNHEAVSLHQYLETCADIVKQTCIDNNKSYTPICPPNLTEKNVIEAMESHDICFIAAHGDNNGIYNENNEDIVTTNTTNYSFNGKLFYSVACLCGKNLCPELLRLGAKVFVGYKDVYYVGKEETLFHETAIEGIKCIIEGRNPYQAKDQMMNKYNEAINSAADFHDKIILLHNWYNLVFEIA